VKTDLAENTQLGSAGESLTNSLAVVELTLGINALTLEKTKAFLGSAYPLGTLSGIYKKHTGRMET
jgi:hypothetical protein